VGTYIVIVVVLSLVVVLVFRLLPLERAFVGGISLLIISGVISLDEFVLSFANEGLVLLALLMIISTALAHSPLFSRLFDFLSSRIRKWWLLNILMGIVIGGVSSFINNTPLMTLIHPYAVKISRVMGFPPSSILYPLMIYISVGGLLTLYGTTTTQIANALVISQRGTGLHPFVFLLPAVCALVVSVLLMSLYRALGIFPQNYNNPPPNSLPLQEEGYSVRRGVALFLFWGSLISLIFSIVLKWPLIYLLVIPVTMVFILRLTPEGFFRQKMEWEVVLIAGLTIALSKAIIKTNAYNFITPLFHYIKVSPFFLQLLFWYFTASVVSSVASARGGVLITLPLLFQFLSGVEDEHQSLCLIIADIYGCSCGFMLPSGHPVFNIAYSSAGIPHKKYVLMGIVSCIVIGLTLCTGIYFLV